MKAHEVFAATSPELSDEILVWFLENKKPIYRAAIAVLAGQRKLRPQFVERKPRAERHLWLREKLSRRAGRDAAQELLQTWLLEAHGEMVKDFLASLDIVHDGAGIVEELPAEPPVEKLEAAVDALLARHRPEVAAVYLQLFQDIDEAHWPGLQQVILARPALGVAATEVPARA